MTPVGVGLVGAGAYGEFCLAAFAQVPEVRIAAICDADSARAQRFAAQYSVPAYTDLDAMLVDASVEIVALNTPPFLHASQGLAVRQAGKHLFCEKPLALTLADGQRMLETARQMGVRLTVDYVMRRNPLWEAAARIRESGILGKLLHADLANHAAGLNLPAAHWFWNKAQSGGIWIEHGVHFFDAFAWAAGQPGTITAAQAFVNAAGQEDRVEALAQYGETAAHFYHGFTHSSANESTTVHLTFESGELTLHEWVPVRLELRLIPEVHAAVRALLRAQFRGLSPQMLEIVENTSRQRMISLTVELPQGKSAVYRECIQAGIRELAQAVHDPALPLHVTGEHALASLKMAVDAENRR